MDFYSKSRSQLLFDLESTYGSDPSPLVAISLPFVNCPLAIDHAPTQSNGLGGGNRNPKAPVYGDKMSDVAITFMMETEAIGYILRTLMGEPTTVDNGDTTYTHTFKLGNEIPSFVLEKGFIDASLFYKYNGMVANGFSFSVAPGDTGIQYTLNCLGGGYEAKEITSMDAAPSDYSRPEKFMFRSDVTFEEAGVANNAITDFTFEFTANTEIIRGLNGAGKGTGAAVSTPQVSGTIRSAFDGDDLLLKGRNNTESSLAITFTDAIHSPNHTLVITIPELKYGQANPELDSPGAAYFTMPWLGYYTDSSEESCVTFVLTNNSPGVVATTTSTSTSSTSTSSSSTSTSSSTSSSTTMTTP